MNVLIACEYSGRTREAFRAKGHDAYSCDLLPAEDDSLYHFQCDVREVLDYGWDLLIAHPTCTRLANSGVRWLDNPPQGRTRADMWDELRRAAEFYLLFRNATHIPKRAIENPIMHKHARALISMPNKRQIVQPHWFGEPAFKATGFELHGLPELSATNRLTIPAKGTEEYKRWSWVHREKPGPDRWKNRSRTFNGIARAMAEQWG